jgi:hypothetical protein
LCPIFYKRIKSPLPPPLLLVLTQAATLSPSKKDFDSPVHSRMCTVALRKILPGKFLQFIQFVCFLRYRLHCTMCTSNGPALDLNTPPGGTVYALSIYSTSIAKYSIIASVRITELGAFYSKPREILLFYLGLYVAVLADLVSLVPVFKPRVLS